MAYKISVIIPIYNAELYIENCIKSIVKQTLNDIEIVCIDDGSEDNTGSVLLNMQKSYNNIQLLKQEHKGAGKARNNGISIAKGEYIAFLDADDEFGDEKALECLYNAAVKNDVVICGGLRTDYVDGQKESGHIYDELGIDITKAQLVKFEEFQDDYEYQNFIFNRDFIIDNNILFPDYLRYQDPPFFLKALHLAGAFWLEPIEVYRYKVGLVSEKQISKKIEYVLKGIIDNLEFAHANGYTRLYDRLINRIEYQFRLAILMNDSENVHESLNIIHKLNNRINYRFPVKVIDEYANIYNNAKLWGWGFAYESEISRFDRGIHIYKYIAELNSKGISLGEIIKSIGIEEIDLYAYGAIGRIVEREMDGAVDIVNIYDANPTQELSECGKNILRSSEIAYDSDRFLLICVANNTGNITLNMVNSGINRQRILSLQALIAIHSKYEKETVNRLSEQYLIAGAYFNRVKNIKKLEHAISIIEKRNPDSIVWIICTDATGKYIPAHIQEKVIMLDDNTLYSGLFDMAYGLSEIISLLDYKIESEIYKRDRDAIEMLAGNYGIKLTRIE